MNSNARIVPEINLDEFERRLRSAGAPQEGMEDPLAELTRLVDMISRDNDNERKAAEAPPIVTGPPSLDFGAREFDNAPPPPPPLLPRAPQMEYEPPVYAEPELEPQPFELSDDERAGLLAAATEAQAPAGQARAWYFKTAGLVIVGVALFGGAAVLKFGLPRAVSKTPPFIAAAQGPTKIQPPSDATVQSASDAGALLTKDSTSSAPVKVVSTAEEPVDLRSSTPAPAASANPSPAASASPSPIAAASPSPVASASPSPSPNAASPVAPAIDTPIVAPGENTATVAPLFPDARPVKTVSVRPDGSLISDMTGSTPSPAPTPVAKTVDRVADNSAAPPAVASEPATPKLDLPTKLSPKSTARVAKTDTTAPASATNTTPNAPLQIGAATRSIANKPAPTNDAQVADAGDAAAAADHAKGGEWAVQLAAPRSEADAQSAISRLKNKYSDALGDAELGIHKADVKGETIYRVRAGGLSKASAAALCSKLKASGGDCFIAKN